MVAVLTVFASHLWHWPPGGFIGVDVFFVISGFLITGNLLRNAETTGNVSFRHFYWNRVRRIVPAATVVLILTYLASTLVFLPFRAHHIGVDALFAFVFMSNWWFAAQNTDYFASGESVSPIQHYWSLSIEEQFYFVWPALIFLIGLIILRRNWTAAHRMKFAGAAMAAIIAVSLGWALYETATFPAFAYFNTFSRVWELGVGALMATAVGALSLIPTGLRPVLSWAGIGVIAASIFLINDQSGGFPAPWAILPVVGASLVIAAGVGVEPRFQAFLRNPVSTYIGDISYSLYLVHWPVIVILGALVDVGSSFYVMVLALSFALAIASYHFVENPLRRGDLVKLRAALKVVRRKQYRPQRSTQLAAVGALALLVVALLSYAPPAPETVASVPAVASTPADPSGQEPTMGPLETQLNTEIVNALQANDWPALDPTMESVIDGPESSPDVMKCGYGAQIDPTRCTWGETTAPVHVLLVGDSVGLGYAAPLRRIALDSGGHIQVHTEAMAGCAFINDLIHNDDQSLLNACTGHIQYAVDTINATKPDVVVISNSYGEKHFQDGGAEVTASSWTKSMRALIDKFRGNTKAIVFLSPPPAGVNPSDCYGTRSSTPVKCVTRVDAQWRTMANAERDLAKTLGGRWIDSRPWFCDTGQRCPIFVGTTPAKHDAVHMAPPYGDKIYPVIRETLNAAGIF